MYINIYLVRLSTTRGRTSALLHLPGPPPPCCGVVGAGETGHGRVPGLVEADVTGGAGVHPGPRHRPRQTLACTQHTQLHCSVYTDIYVYKQLLLWSTTVMSQIAPRHKQEPVLNKAPLVDNPLSCLKHLK